MDGTSDGVGTSGTPDISVIVPVYDGGDSYRQCLQGIAQAVRPGDEVIVVADGGADRAADLAQALGFQVVRQPRRSGPAAARNLGARRARGGILLFIDSDVVVPPDILSRVRREFEADPRLAALFGSYDDRPGAKNFLSQYKNLLHHYVHQTSSEQAGTFWGACGAIRRETFLAVGGFDEGYGRPCVEDIALGYALTRAGHRIRLCKDIQVKHLKVWTAWSLVKTDFLRRAVPWTELILRHRRLANDLNLRTSSRASVLLVYALAACLALGAWQRWFLLIAGAAAIALLAINAPVYGFLRRKRGLGFALKAVPWHWFYYLYGGLGFALGVARHWLGGTRASKATPATGAAARAGAAPPGPSGDVRLQ